MKRVKEVIKTFITILSGATASSMWITHSDNWKVFIPITLLLIAFYLQVCED